MPEMPSIDVVGMGWYTPDSYPKCLAIFNDPGYFPETFDEWLTKAEKTEQQFLRRGATFVRVEIDPDTFPKWCVANGYEVVDPKARVHFASLKAAESIGFDRDEDSNA